MPRSGRPRRGRRPTLAVWKFASCDGCQLTLLNCEEELLAVAGAVEIANFPEASSAVLKGPYDLSLVEGSITTPHDAERIHEVRRLSKTLVAVGACATAGGIQALRNSRDVAELVRVVYANPSYINTLARSTPIADHVRVDVELRGCPISRGQLLEAVSALLNGRRPAITTDPVCLECKRRDVVCVMAARGLPCLGPVTQSGCGAICPAFGRACYGCFGPADAPATRPLTEAWRRAGASPAAIARAFRTFNAGAEPFRKAAEAHEA